MSNFVPVDLPGQDPELQQEPTDVLADLAEEAKHDLYMFNTAVLGYKKLTPPVHGPLCNFFDLDRSQYKLALYPRDHFKTTCITIGGTLQRACREPDKTTHIKNERVENASRFLDAMKAHCLTNSMFRTLYGKYVPPDTRKVAWNDTEMMLMGRTVVKPEPTISCSGVESATTSNHYDHITWDDPISEKAVKEPTTMESTWDRMVSAINLLSEPEISTIWIVGTNWAFGDVYAKWMKNFAQYTSKLARGAIEDGKPIFPELISLQRLDMLRAADPYLFSCNWMNNPKNADVQNFDIRALKRWKFTTAFEDEIAIYDPLTAEILVTVDVDKLDITVTVDLAVAEKITSDRNAICVMGVEPTKGYCVFLELWGERCSPGRVMDKLFEVQERWHPRIFGIEAVAYQKAFKWFLDTEAQKRGVWLPIKDLKAIGKKEVRVAGLQPMVRTGRCAISPEHQLFLTEMDEWPLSEHDDVLESASMQLQVANHWFSPERLEKVRAAERRMLRSHGIIPVDEIDPHEQEIIDRVRALTSRYANVSVTNLYN